MARPHSALSPPVLLVHDCHFHFMNLPVSKIRQRLAGNRFHAAVGRNTETGHGIHNQALNQNGGDHIEPVGKSGLYSDF